MMREFGAFVVPGSIGRRLTAACPHNIPIY
jgi:hypothetical protein